MNKNHLKYICAELQLGAPSQTITRIYGSRGGSIIWKIKTKQGYYAIKQLSLEIDLTNEKMVNKYELSEKLAYHFSQQGIPAISAIEGSGKRLIIIENIGYLVYPWVEGYILGRNEISESHALKIAEIIAKLHNINMSLPEIGEPRFDIHSNDKITDAIERLISLKNPLAKKIKGHENFILTVNDIYQTSISILKEHSVVTHGDLNQLNIIWNKTDQPILIDWESVRKLNPTREIIRASLDWSGISTENFSLSIYNSMLHKYINSGGILNKNHILAALHSGFGSQINWILYNINSYCNSVDQKEKDTATEEINGTIIVMKNLQRLIPRIQN